MITLSIFLAIFLTGTLGSFALFELLAELQLRRRERANFRKALIRVLSA